MADGIKVTPPEHRASWARRVVAGIDVPNTPRPELVPPPEPAITTYNLHVVIDMPHAAYLELVERIRDRLADLNPRGIELT